MTCASIFSNGHSPRGGNTRWTGRSGHSLTPRGHFQPACNSTKGNHVEETHANYLNPGVPCVLYLSVLSPLSGLSALPNVQSSGSAIDAMKIKLN